MGKKKRHYHKRNKPKLMQLKKQTVMTVGAIWMWIIAIIFLLSFFYNGSLLIPIKQFFLDHVGWTYYLLPPFLILLSFLFFKLKSEIGKPNVATGYALLVVSLTGITRSGIFGEQMWSLLSGAVSDGGAFLALLGLIIVSLIVMFNASLDTLVNNLVSMIGTFFTPRKDAGKKGPLIKNGVVPVLSKTPLKIKGVDEKSLLKSTTASPVVSPLKQNPVSSLGKNEIKQDLKISSPNIQNENRESALWEYPPLSLLSEISTHKADRGDVRKNAHVIEETLTSFGIDSHVEEVNTGPAITQYALKLALGTKVSKITSLSSDLALALAAPTGQVRIEAPIPGRNLVGVEIPNRGLELVTLKRMLQSDQMNKSKSKLAVTLGLDVSGNPVIADIGRMPHVLVAGTTGSGKSVLINSWICSILFRTSPKEVRLIMVDPKRVELSGYNGVPHLLTPVIVEPDKILSALRWAIKEMEERYKKFAEVSVRNIDSFNELSGFQAMSYIVILIDELADLMAYAPVEVEDAICRLAQMARATGIHLVLATQRPSVDVITGLIKANVPSRIAFNVSSMIDSRVIIDSPGAEKLLGRGDMLYVPPDQSKPSRIQGTFVSEQEVVKVVDFLKNRNVPVEYTEEVLKQPLGGSKKGQGQSLGGGDGKDQLFEDAIRLICQHDKASASLLQRRLSVGYARAARILDQLEEAGVIGPGEGSKPRDVLVKNAEEYLSQVQNDGETE